MKLKNRSGSMPLKRSDRILVSVASRSLRFRSSRRLTSCWPWPGASVITRPLRWSMPMNCCSSSMRIVCGGKLALEPLGDLVEARLAVEHLQDRVLFFLEAEVLQADRVLDDPVDAALVALLPRLADRAACESAASARSWRPGCRQAWPWRRVEGLRVERSRARN